MHLSISFDSVTVEGLTGALTLQERFDGEFFGIVAGSRPVSVDLQVNQGTKMNTMKKKNAEMSLLHLYRGQVNQGTHGRKFLFLRAAFLRMNMVFVQYNYEQLKQKHKQEGTT